MRKRSKILAIILSVAMVGSMWSPVFAEETTEVATEAATEAVVEEEAAEPVEEAVEAEAVEEEAPVEEAATPDEVVIENDEETVAPAEEAAEVVEADPVDDGEAGATFAGIWFDYDSINTSTQTVNVYKMFTGEVVVPQTDGTKTLCASDGKTPITLSPSDTTRYVGVATATGTVEATCEAGSGYTFVYKYDGKEYTGTYTGKDALGHKWTDEATKKVEATHSAPGYIAYYKSCANCGKIAGLDVTDNSKFANGSYETLMNDTLPTTWTEEKISAWITALKKGPNEAGKTYYPYKVEMLPAAHTYTTEVNLPVTSTGAVWAINTTGTGCLTKAQVEAFCNLEVEEMSVGNNKIWVVKMTNGEPTLKTKTSDGYYVTTKLCSEYVSEHDTFDENNCRTGVECCDALVTAGNNVYDSLGKGNYTVVPATEMEDVEAAEIIETKNIDHIGTVVTTADITSIAGGTAKDITTAQVNASKKFVAFAEKDIVLTDCSEAGSYTVKFTTATKTYSQEYTVAAHHTETTVIEAKKDTVTVAWSTSGVPTVTAVSCADGAEYSVVTVCESPKCSEKTYTIGTDYEAFVSGESTSLDSAAVKGKDWKVIKTETATVEATGKHYTDRDAIDAVIKTLNGTAGKEKTYYNIAGKSEVSDAVKAGRVKLTPSTDDCTKAGSVIIEYSCKICKKVVDSETVSYDAGDHEFSKTISILESTDATCTTEGSVTTAKKCTHSGCTQVDEEKTITTKKLPHTNQVPTSSSTTADSNGYFDDVLNETSSQQYLSLEGNVVIDYNNAVADVKAGESVTDKLTFSDSNGKVKGDVSAYAYTLCTECGGHAVKLTGTSDKPEVTLVSAVEKEGATCKPGSITLKATYKGYYTDANDKTQSVDLSETKTFQYYSSELAYSGRTAHIEGETKKENEVAATETENGGYDLVTYCKVCGTVMKTEHVTVAATGVKLPAVQNLKAETKSMNRVKLTWDKLDGAIGYIVLGLNETGRYGNQIAYTTQTSWTDTAADSEAYNFYWVVGVSKNAENKNVVGELGSYVYAIGRVVGATTNLAAKTASNGVTLTWTKASNANGYVILSRKGRTGKANKLTSVGDVASYTDTTADGTTFYWVYGTYTNEEGKTVVAGATSNYAYATK